MEWLSAIRNVIASVFRVSLDVADPVTSGAEDEGELGDRQRQNMRQLWIVVGKYTPAEAIGYELLGEAWLRVADDIGLEVWIGPDRISQVRIVYTDPRARRGEGDSVVSKIGAWAIVPHELAREILGDGPGDEDALATRYAETAIPTFYVYFSADVIPPVTHGATFGWTPGKQGQAT